MSTRTVTLTAEERRILLEFLWEEGDKVKEAKLLTRPDSPEEHRAQAEFDRILTLRGKLL